MSTVRRSSRLAAKAPQSNQVPPPMEYVVRVKYTRAPKEKITDIPAPIEAPMEAPAVTPAVWTDEEHRKYCERMFLINKIQDYITRISNLRVSNTKLELVIDMFALIEEKMAFLASSEFSKDTSFVNILYLKSIEIQDQLDQLKNSEISDGIRQAAITILKRVHKKIHLYLINNQLRDDIYNEFLQKFINQV